MAIHHYRRWSYGVSGRNWKKCAVFIDDLMVLPSSFAREIVIDTTVAISIFHRFFSSWIRTRERELQEKNDEEMEGERDVVRWNEWKQWWNCRKKKKRTVVKAWDSYNVGRKLEMIEERIRRKGAAASFQTCYETNDKLYILVSIKSRERERESYQMPFFRHGIGIVA